MWFKEISFSDVICITKRNMENAVWNLTKHLDTVSEAISNAKKHLCHRLGFRRYMGQVGLALANIGDDFDALHVWFLDFLMANLGGFKQYEDKANSSHPRDTHDPTGEPETLWGIIDPRSFGDRVDKGKPQELEDKLKMYKKKKERDVVDDTVNLRQSKRRRLREESVLTDDMDAAVYQPKSNETRAAYEAMLCLIQHLLGGQPLSIVTGAADEILAVLKSEKPEKKMEIHKLLNYIEDREFDQLVSFGKLITDFQEAGDSSGGGEDDEDNFGVAVEFEDNEEESDQEDIVQEEDCEEDQELSRTGGMQVGAGIYDKDANEGSNLNVQDIDAYWLQRRISQAYQHKIDPQQCQVLADDLLRDVENKLLLHLEKFSTTMHFEKFSLVHFLLRNRLKVVWCTRLARAQDQEQRNRIEEEMRAFGPELTSIVEQLQATRATAKEREENLQKSIHEEARRLKEEAGGDVADRDLESGWVKGQRQLLDLESLAFDQGAHLMANKKCDLPPGSYRIHGKGYDEVHVPWVSKKVDRNEKLVKITEMPDWAQPAFKGMQQLNRVQSKVYETALFKTENILLCAPTGAGKTNVAMLTILQQLELNRNEDGTYNHGDYKIVYVAPMKALVAEVVGNLSNCLKDYGVTVRELSGDQSLTGREIKETQVIVTTPEKWDIITRKSRDRTYTQFVRLLIIDGIHLLHDNRGPVLESIVARTLRQIETTKDNIRLVGLSATLPNYEDVALFLRVDLKKGLFKFDSSYRPVSLYQQYIGISVKEPLQRFQLMNDLCYQNVLACAGKHQVLIFVHSREETAKTAIALCDTAMANDTLSRFLKEDSESREVLLNHFDFVKYYDLKGILPYGFAIHHAGLTRSDREIVEGLFAKGHVQVLVSTTTFAWGVNLPAHTAIIKGTKVYNPEKGAWMELNPLDVMQMLGRAGRPKYDQHGEDPPVKANTLLQAHFSRQNIDGNLAMNQSMEVSQMVTQGMWERDSMLLQLPHFTKVLAKRCQENPGKNIETVVDLVEIEDEERQELLKMSDAQRLDIARFCNHFPNIDLTYEVMGSEEVTPGKEVTLQVMLERDMEGKTEVGPVESLRYPKTKEEGWWLVVGDTKTNQLLAIKRVSLQRNVKVKLAFTVPSELGEKSYTLYFMCDSYLGCDQEYSFSVDVKGSGVGDHMEK
ncbi:unnamed protein product [Arabidopsis lyrata]|nr:unnamed protein product [Arabidopsis lyrata]